MTAPFSVEELRRLLSYDKETGIFTRLIGTGKGAAKGDVAGGLDRGYVCISVKGKKYYAHRLAWYYVTGQWPERLVDHRDRNRSNNRWDNIRLADRVQNAGNSTAHHDNTSGYKGVSFHGKTGKWRASIGVKGRQLHLGLFCTPELAHDAYSRAAKQYFEDFARTE